MIEPDEFGYPVKQRWFATSTQMANEPVYVDGGERPQVKKIYYHSGEDIGGAEGLVDVVAATDGVVVSVGSHVLEGHGRKADRDSPVAERYDVVYVLDARGWYYRYSHLQVIMPSIVPESEVRITADAGGAIEFNIERSRGSSLNSLWVAKSAGQSFRISAKSFTRDNVI